MLKEIIKLDIKNNRFEGIPSNIGALRKLCIFIASGNKIKDISPLIACKELHTIDLRHNNIQHVPVQLPLKLAHLSKFYMENQLAKEVQKNNLSTNPSLGNKSYTQDNSTLSIGMSFSNPSPHDNNVDQGNLGMHTSTYKTNKIVDTASKFAFSTKLDGAGNAGIITSPKTTSQSKRQNYDTQSLMQLKEGKFGKTKNKELGDNEAQIKATKLYVSTQTKPSSVADKTNNSNNRIDSSLLSKNTVDSNRNPLLISNVRISSNLNPTPFSNNKPYSNPNPTPFSNSKMSSTPTLFYSDKRSRKIKDSSVSSGSTVFGNPTPTPLIVSQRQPKQKKTSNKPIGLLRFRQSIEAMATKNEERSKDA
jgi:hypothetical protein